MAILGNNLEGREEGSRQPGNSPGYILVHVVYSKNSGYCFTIIGLAENILLVIYIFGTLKSNTEILK